MEKTGILRQLLKQDKIIVAPGIHNALAAKMVEAFGFPIVYITGSGLSTTFLGAPDVGLMTLTEVTTLASRIVDSVDVPVVCDADTGYGNAINVQRTIREFERAGVAGVHIEDQVSPKRCGHLTGKQCISVPEMVGKLKAALDARRDPDFLIIARTDARSVLGAAEAVRRGNAYHEAGADMVLLDAALSVDEMRTYAEEIDGPLVITLGGYGRERTTPKVPIEELEAIGYSMVILPLAILRAAARAMWDFCHELQQRGVAAEEEFISQINGHPIEDWYEFVGTKEIRKLEGKYLPPEEVERKYRETKGYQL